MLLIIDNYFIQVLIKIVVNSVSGVKWRTVFVPTSFHPYEPMWTNMKVVLKVSSWTHCIAILFGLRSKCANTWQFHYGFLSWHETLLINLTILCYTMGHLSLHALRAISRSCCSDWSVSLLSSFSSSGVPTCICRQHVSQLPPVTGGNWYSASLLLHLTILVVCRPPIAVSTSQIFFNLVRVSVSSSLLSHSALCCICSRYWNE